MPVVVAGALNGLAFYYCRKINKIIADFSLNTVVEYADPWVTIAFLMLMAALGVGSWRVLRAPRLRSWSKVWRVGLLYLLSLLFTAELSSAVLFSFRSSSISAIYLACLVAPKRMARDESGDGGPCVRADVSGFYTWYVNGVALHPRLLLLPLVSVPGSLEEQLNIFKCLDPPATAAASAKPR